MQLLQYVTGENKQIDISIPKAFRTKNIIFANVFK